MPSRDSDLVLACSRCGYETSDLTAQRCGNCEAGLECEYADLEERRLAQPWPPDLRQTLTRRYADLLPPFARRSQSLGEGHMVLMRDEALARRVGCSEVFLAFEGLNPTGTFKDRGTTVAMAWALERGSRVVGTVSTGNMAASVAAYARRNSIAAAVVVATTVPDYKLDLARIYAPSILKVDIDHGSLYFDALAAGRQTGVYFMNGDDPMRIEGQKTALYDAYAHLYPNEPSHIFLPLSSGGNFLAYDKALRELPPGVRRPTRLVGVQPSGCAPIWQALRTGSATMTAIAEPRSIARTITNPYPPSGDRVLDSCRKRGHDVRAVDDDELIAVRQDLVSRHGLWVQVDSAASIAGLCQAAAEGELEAGSTAVCVLTGAGYRDPGVPPAERGQTHAVKATGLTSALSDLIERAEQSELATK